MHAKSIVGRPSRVRVLVVDGGRPVSFALADWLQTHPGIGVTGPVESVAAAIMIAAKIRPHVVLLDFHGLPVSVGYAVVLFKQLAPRMPVFVLTHDASETMRRRCRDAGADRVFDKTSDLEPLVDAIMSLKNSGHGTTGL